MDAIDAGLVERTLAGERSAYEALVARHLARARAVASAILNDPSADDAVQEGFIKAYDRLGELSAPGRFGAWVVAIIRNEAIALRRRRARETPLSIAQAAPLPEPDDDERVIVVRRHMPRLNDDQRAILALRYEAGCDAESIAQTLGISVAAAEKRLQRAKLALQALVERDPEWPHRRSWP